MEEVGTVQAGVLEGRIGKALTTGCEQVVEDAKLGDSIAVKGVCLTVTDFNNAGGRPHFAFGASPQTQGRTNPGRLQPDDRVNLERSPQVGGHYAQSHIDGTGGIIGLVPDSGSLRSRFGHPAHLLPYIVERGYIAVDGTSLTIAERTADTFTIALIAYTRGATIMGQQVVGAVVNLEVDVMAKYVESIIRHVHATGATTG